MPHAARTLERRALAHARAASARAAKELARAAEEAAQRAEEAAQREAAFQALVEELAQREAAFADQSSRLAEQQAAHMAEHNALLSQLRRMGEQLKQKDAALLNCMQVSEQVELAAQRDLREADAKCCQVLADAMAEAGGGRE